MDYAGLRDNYVPKIYVFQKLVTHLHHIACMAEHVFSASATILKVCDPFLPLCYSFKVFCMPNQILSQMLTAIVFF